MTSLDSIKRPNSCEVQQQLASIKEIPIIKNKKKRNLLVSLMFLILCGFIYYQWINFQENQNKLEFLNSTANEISDIKVKLNTLFTLPKHNIRPEWELLDKQRDKIIVQLNANKKISIAKKNELIGRAYFVNRDYNQSIEYLEKAWNSGVKTPELAYQLGYNYLMIYDGLTGYRSIWQADSEEDRKTIKGNASNKIVAKSKYYFDYFTSHRQQSSWRIKTYQLLINKKYQEALALIDIESLHKNADYENFDLLGSIYQNLMNENARKKDYVAMEKYYDLSISHYKNAIEYARSYPVPYKHICNLITDKLEISIFSAQNNALKQLNEVKHYCNDVLTIYPNSNQMVNELIGFDTRYAEYLMGLGFDARQPLKEAISLSEKIPSKACKSYGSLGILNDLLAEQEYDKGGNPVATINKAIRAYQNSLKHCPEEITLISGNMFYSYMVLLKYQISQGRHPIVEMEKAKEVLEKQQNSSYKRLDTRGNMSSNYGDLLRLMAYSSLLHKLNPNQWLEQAQDSYKESIAIEGQAPYPVGGLAGVDLIKSEYALSKGTLTKTKLDDLSKQIDAAMEIGGNLDWIVLLKADSLRLEYEFTHKIETFKQADKFYLTAIRKNANNFNTHINRAKLMFDAISWQSKTHDQSKYHEIALKEIEFVLKIIPNFVEAKNIKARLKNKSKSQHN